MFLLEYVYKADSKMPIFIWIWWVGHLYQTTNRSWKSPYTTSEAHLGVNFGTNKQIFFIYGRNYWKLVIEIKQFYKWVWNLSKKAFNFPWCIHILGVIKWCFVEIYRGCDKIRSRFWWTMGESVYVFIIYLPLALSFLIESLNNLFY
jgi:hypothetical protein